MSEQTWVTHIIAAIDEAISNRFISKADLAEGLEEIEEHSGEWARVQRAELAAEEDEDSDEE